MAAILQLEQVRKTYIKGENQVHALAGVDLTIEQGEFLAVVGPSGSGKTTLLNIVGCLDSPSSGRVLYKGESLGAMKEDQLSDYRKEHISFIFQSYNLIPVLTVRENVELPLVIERKLSKEAIRAKADEVIASVGLKGLGERYPRELSGGQEQRVAIARALVKEPYIVLADEPTANLDSHTAEEIVDIMREINRTKGATFIFSTHDPLVQKHARRVLTIRDGLVHADERK
ncbi:MAG TPA: lipoprotein-releasing system ATP-binding protein LolD [Spirochaetaceae bacterium]|jgi:putative ABC transport system ATP-binding protein|nr:lipoprotein-releasing system ATP-binding protein LolD [Spirochaetaceae bacterium]